jgi:cyclopropane fatty-acyl-phospholipid synthase-like methyltransferase
VTHVEDIGLHYVYVYIYIYSTRVQILTQKGRWQAVTHVEDIGLHYATTLKMWHDNWLAAEVGPP